MSNIHHNSLTIKMNFLMSTKRKSSRNFSHNCSAIMHNLKLTNMVTTNNCKDNNLKTNEDGLPNFEEEEDDEIEHEPFGD